MTQLSLNNRAVLKNAIIQVLMQEGACSAIRVSKLIISSKPRGLQGKSLTMMRIVRYLQRLREDGIVESHERIWAMKSLVGGENKW